MYITRSSYKQKHIYMHMLTKMQETSLCCSRHVHMNRNLQVKHTWLPESTGNDVDGLSVGQSLSEQNSLIHSRKLSPYFIAFSSATSSSSVRLSTVVGLNTDNSIRTPRVHVHVSIRYNTIWCFRRQLKPFLFQQSYPDSVI